MDELDTYQADLSMPEMDLGDGMTMTSSSHAQVDVANNVVYQVTESGGGAIPTPSRSR